MNRLAAVFMATFSFATLGEALEIRCPEKIQTTQRLDKQEAGWQEFVRPNGDGGVDAYAYVSGISIYDDDPKLLYELKPDNETARDPSWTFTKPAPGTPPLYMACHYAQTRIQFVRALPANVRKCTAKRDGVLQCDMFKP